MELKTVFRAASGALVVLVAAAALVACGGASTSDVPTTVVSSSTEVGTVSACSFTSPRDGSAVDGTCHTGRDDASQLVCRPNDWPDRGERGDGQWGPPQESLSACEGIETGAACSFEAPFGTVDGTCSARPDGSGEVACHPEWNGEDRPEDRRPGRGGHGHEEALAACADKQADATCSFESPFGSVSGTCRTGRDGSALVCAPRDWPGR
jgi:hypothetical protein